MSVSVERVRFNSGEWSPELHARTDLDKYPGACKQLSNFIPRAEGGIFNRPGLKFILNYGAYDAADGIRLIPFEFSADQNYFVAITATGAFIIKDKAAIVATITGTFTYTVSELSEITFTQDGNEMWLFHSNHAPRKLVRDSSDETVWTLTTPTFGPDAPKPTTIANVASTGGWNFVVTSVNQETGEESEETAPRYAFDVTANAGETITWDAMFDSEGDPMDYRIYVLVNGTKGPWGFVKQQGTTSYLVPASGFDPSALDAGFPYYRKDTFSSTGKYPAVGTFYQQRLILAGTDNEPNTIWGSHIGIYLNFSRNEEVNDGDAFKFTLASKKVNAIRWMIPLDVLIFGTTGGEWVMTPGTAGGAVTASSVDLRQQSDWGSSKLQPELIGRSIIFNSKARKTGRDMEFSFQTDGYAARDMMLFAKHLFRGKQITNWAFQRDPNSILWVIADNKLFGLTYLKEQDVYAWHTHNSYNCDFLSVAVLADGDGKDDVYFVTRRYLEDRSASYVGIEYLSEHLPDNISYKETDEQIDLKDAVFLDYSATYDDPKTISGFTSILVGLEEETRITVTSHGYVTGDEDLYFFDIDGVAQPSELNGRFRFQVIDANTLRVKANTALTTAIADCAQIDSSAYGGYTEGGEVRKAIALVSGFDHLDNWTGYVDVVADGIVLKNQFVNGGAIILTVPASRIHAGFKYTAIAEPLDFLYTGRSGSIKDKFKRVTSAVLSLDKTRCIQVGTDTTDLEDYVFPDAENYGEPIPFYTGDIEVSLEAGSSERSSRIYAQCDDPVSCSIIGITGRVDAGSN